LATLWQFPDRFTSAPSDIRAIIYRCLGTFGGGEYLDFTENDVGEFFCKVEIRWLRDQRLPHWYHWQKCCDPDSFYAAVSG
jgi:hypothetical protein